METIMELERETESTRDCHLSEANILWEEDIFQITEEGQDYINIYETRLL